MRVLYIMQYRFRSTAIKIYNTYLFDSDKHREVLLKFGWVINK